MIKPTMSMAVDEAHLNELLVAHYQALEKQHEQDVEILKYACQCAWIVGGLLEESAEASLITSTLKLALKATGDGQERKLAREEIIKLMSA